MTEKRPSIVAFSLFRQAFFFKLLFQDVERKRIRLTAGRATKKVNGRPGIWSATCRSKPSRPPKNMLIASAAKKDSATPSGGSVLAKPGSNRSKPGRGCLASSSSRPQHWSAWARSCRSAILVEQKTYYVESPCGAKGVVN